MKDMIASDTSNRPIPGIFLGGGGLEGVSVWRNRSEKGYGSLGDQRRNCIEMRWELPLTGVRNLFFSLFSPTNGGVDGVRAEGLVHRRGH